MRSSLSGTRRGPSDGIFSRHLGPVHAPAAIRKEPTRVRSQSTDFDSESSVSVVVFESARKSRPLRSPLSGLSRSINYTRHRLCTLRAHTANCHIFITYRRPDSTHFATFPSLERSDLFSPLFCDFFRFFVGFSFLQKSTFKIPCTLTAPPLLEIFLFAKCVRICACLSMCVRFFFSYYWCLLAALFFLWNSFSGIPFAAFLPGFSPPRPSQLEFLSILLPPIRGIPYPPL